MKINIVKCLFPRKYICFLIKDIRFIATEIVGCQHMNMSSEDIHVTIPIIGLLGKRGSGKSTCTNFMKELDIIEEAFANPLKLTTKVMFGFTDKQVFGDIKDKETIDPRWGISPRLALQYIGTNVVRNGIREILPAIGEDFWVRHMEMKISQHLNDPGIQGISVSDVRFPNEVKSIRKLKGFVIKITRPSPEIKKDGYSEHPSETAIDEIKDFDYEIINDGTLEELKKKLLEIIKQIQARILLANKYINTNIISLICNFM